MRLIATFTVKLELNGSTGYCNQSKLKLLVQDLGIIELPYKGWNIESIISYEPKFYSLNIPSGELKPIDVYEQNVEIVYEDGKRPYIQWNFGGVWVGIAGGVENGMSGYCSFTFDQTTAIVKESAFLGRHNLNRGSWSNRPYCHMLDSDVWAKYEDYVINVEAHTSYYGYDKSRSWARDARPSLIISSWDRTPEQQKIVDEWLDGIDEAIKAYQPATV